MASLYDLPKHPAKKIKLSPKRSLEGRVAVVTGSGSGIGRVCAFRLAKEGAKVVVADINETESAITVAEIKKNGGECFFQHLDAKCEESIKACMEKTIEVYGEINILVNNAVQFRFGHLHPEGMGSKTGSDKNPSAKDWDDVLKCNVIGYANCIKHAMTHMTKNELPTILYPQNWGEGTSQINAGSRGTIVNIASVSSWIAQPEFVPYNASKAAILSMTKCCAKDFAKFKIRVNAVCPGTVETKGSYAHMRTIKLSIEEGRKEFADSCELKRQGAPEEIANVVNFLVSDESSFMTGAHLVVDGGGTI